MIKITPLLILRGSLNHSVLNMPKTVFLCKKNLESFRPVRAKKTDIFEKRV